MAHLDRKVKKTTKQLVESVLKEYPFTRDNDQSLYGTVLNISKPDWQKWSAVQLLNAIDDRIVPSMIDVIRYRQRFQQINSSLRGNNYEARKKNQQVAQQVLSYGSSSSR